MSISIVLVESVTFFRWCLFKNFATASTVSFGCRIISSILIILTLSKRSLCFKDSLILNRHILQLLWHQLVCHQVSYPAAIIASEAFGAPLLILERILSNGCLVTKTILDLDLFSFCKSVLEM